MGNKALLYVGTGILLLIGLCLFFYGVVNFIASTSPGRESLLTAALIFTCGGVLFLGGGIGLAVMAAKMKGADAPAQNITYKVDLPAQTKIEEVKCRNCGGGLKADNIKMIAGAPTVECPFCGTTYQMTEEPKW